MRVLTSVLVTSICVLAVGHIHVGAQGSSTRALPAISQTPIQAVTALASRLELDRYKATIKSLTQFGDRRQGTERNRKAVDWIEMDGVEADFGGVPVGE